jgi:hypothetical protein
VPSLPAVQALSWLGFFLVLGGAIEAYTFCAMYAVALASLDATGATTGLGSGGALLAFSLFCLFVSCILVSVAGCCTVGNLPGVGVRRGCCCCVENNADQLEDPAAAAAAKTAVGLGAPGGPGSIVVRAVKGESNSSLPGAASNNPVIFTPRNSRAPGQGQAAQRSASRFAQQPAPSAM